MFSMCRSKVQKNEEDTVTKSIKSELKFDREVLIASAKEINGKIIEYERGIKKQEVKYMRYVWDMYCELDNYVLDADKKCEVFNKIKDANNKWNDSLKNGEYDEDELDEETISIIRGFHNKLHKLYTKRQKIVDCIKKINNKLSLLEEYENNCN